MPIVLAWIFAFFIGAFVIAAIGGVIVWTVENPDEAPYIIAYLIGSVLVGWLLVNWFGWWDVWLRG